MALRKALSYSKKHARPYTRVSRAKGKSYIKVVPHNKIVKYNGGNKDAHTQGKYPVVLSLVAQEDTQIRDNALESTRQMLTKALDKRLFGNYYLEMKVHPHHILRNNKTAAGAGADRLSSGMKHSFGVIEGRAARVKNGSVLFRVSCENEAANKFVREAFGMTKAKLPCSSKVVFEKG